MRQAMRTEAAADLKRVKAEQRRLEQLTAADLNQLQQLHDQRVTHLEKLLDEESQRVQEARTQLAQLNMERAAAANESARMLEAEHETAKVCAESRFIIALLNAL